MMYLTQIIGYFNLVFIPIFLYSRLKKEGYRIVLNPPYLYLLSLYFYTVIPSYSVFGVNLFNIPENVQNITDLYSNTFVLLIFLLNIFYKNSVVDVDINFRIPRLVYKTATVLLISITVYYLFIYIKYLPTLYSLSGRMQRVVYYDENIFIGGRFITLNVFYFVSIAIIAWRRNSITIFSLGFLPMIAEILTFARIDLIKWTIFCYINIVCIKKKLYLKAVVFAFLLIGSLGVIRFEEFNLMNAFGEFAGCRGIIDFSHLHFIEKGFAIQDFVDLILIRSIPNYIANIFEIQKPDQLFVATLQQDYFLPQAAYNPLATSGSAIAGHIIAEPLYYGGWIFAFFTAFVSFFFFRFFNLILRFKYISFFIITSFLSGQIIVQTRTDFYPMVTGTLYIYFVYFFWIYFPELTRFVGAKSYDRLIRTKMID